MLSDGSFAGVTFSLDSHSSVARNWSCTPPPRSSGPLGTARPGSVPIPSGRNPGPSSSIDSLTTHKRSVPSCRRPAEDLSHVDSRSPRLFTGYRGVYSPCRRVHCRVKSTALSLRGRSLADTGEGGCGRKSRSCHRADRTSKPSGLEARGVPAQKRGETHPSHRQSAKQRSPDRRRLRRRWSLKSKHPA